MTTPLLIGGATTSRVHTAVKIAPRVLDAGRPRRGRVAGRGVAGALRRRGGPRGVRRGRPRPSTRRSAASARRGRARATAVDRGRAREPRPAWTGRPRRRVPTFLGVAGVRRLPARRAGRADRLDAVLPHLGAPGRLPGDPRRPARGAGGERPVPRRPGAARPDRRRGPPARRAPSSGSGRRTRRPTTTSSCGPTSRGRPGAGPHPRAAPADGEARRAAEPFRRRLGRAGRACADHIGAFAVTAGHGIDELVRQFEAANDDYSRDPGQGPRGPARGGVRGADARAGATRAVGLRAGRGAAATTTSSPSATRASARRPATRRRPTTSPRRRCSSCSTRRRGAGCSSPSRWRCCPRRRSPGSTCGTPTRHYFGIGRIGRDQLEPTTRAGPGCRSTMPRAGSSPNLAEDARP